MKLGVFVLIHDHDMREEFRRLRDNGFTTCQLQVWDDNDKTDEKAAEINAAKEEFGIEITALWCGWSGPSKWNFTEGPCTLGIVPTAYRHHRMEELMRGCDFAVKIGVTDVITHMGFIPENPHDPLYAGMIDALREVAEHLEKNGQYFLFETGQETPVTLLRAIEDIGTGNLGVNLDTANLILYGKAHPVDALEILGKYVMDVHVKDGKWPTDGWNLGEETALGEGKVNFPAVMAKLKQIGYDGVLTIEREISGEKQIEDILKAKKMLEDLM